MSALFVCSTISRKLGSLKHRNLVDIGLTSAAGLTPPELTVQEAMTGGGQSGVSDRNGITTSLDLTTATSTELVCEMTIRHVLFLEWK